MSYAPIAVFVYNRADHFKETVEALAACAEAKASELFIFSDGAKNDAAADKVNEVRALAYEVKGKDWFRNVNIIESNKNKGLAESIISGVTQVVQRFGKIIVVEDDCVASKYFLKYMNECLDYYKDNKKIGSIAGYAPPIDMPVDYEADIFYAYRSCSWGWATWKDRWDNIDWKLDNIKELYGNKKMVKLFNSNGTDRFLRLYRQTKGSSSSWSVKFGFHLVINDMMTVYPRYSYIKNIGCDNTGIHSKAENGEKVKVDLADAKENPVIKEVAFDKNIQKSMKKFYSNGWMSEIRRFAATKRIIIKERLKK